MERADGKDRNVNTFVQTCGSTERRVMDCVAGRGFTGKPSKQISDKTDPSSERGGKRSGDGPALGHKAGGEGTWLKQRLCLLRK